ncbi:hypothetical protein [Mesomycoplasma ovipneumoniae]|uniref:hypothetical protein n=1 Tax=Mesomycoplasma ovipneumoniae TaxID=29562 RepID=UPI0031192D72
MLVQSELTKIIIDIFLPSSVKNNKNVDDLKIMDKKLNSPIDFYSRVSQFEGKNSLFIESKYAKTPVNRCFLNVKP